MTRRERIGRKLEQRLNWADSREKKAELEQEVGNKISMDIPPGQPIHRKDLKKIRKHAGNVIEHISMAEKHRDKAANLTNIGQRIRQAKNRLETLLEKKHE